MFHLSCLHAARRGAAERGLDLNCAFLRTLVVESRRCAAADFGAGTWRDAMAAREHFGAAAPGTSEASSRADSNAAALLAGLASALENSGESRRGVANTEDRARMDSHAEQTESGSDTDDEYEMEHPDDSDGDEDRGDGDAAGTFSGDSVDALWTAAAASVARCTGGGASSARSEIQRARMMIGAAMLSDLHQIV